MQQRWTESDLSLFGTAALTLLHYGSVHSIRRVDCMLSSTTTATAPTLRSSSPDSSLHQDVTVPHDRDQGHIWYVHRTTAVLVLLSLFTGAGESAPVLLHMSLQLPSTWSLSHAA